MTTQEMGKGLNYLKAFYTTWGLDITNEIVLQVWFDALKELEYKTFLYILKKYCVQNKFGPASPHDILSLIPKLSSTDDAYDVMLDIMSRSSNSTIAVNMLIKYPTIYPIGAKYLKIIDNMPLDSFGNKCYGYVLRTFKREYQEMLNSQQVYYDCKSMKLEKATTKLLA